MTGPDVTTEVVKHHAKTDTANYTNQNSIGKKACTLSSAAQATPSTFNEHGIADSPRPHNGSVWPSPQIRTCIFAAFAYVVLLAADSWAFGTFNLEKGSATVLESNCREIKAISTGLHLVMNILGTLLLGASTLTMQNLCAPTRQEVDKAHSNRKRLDVGIQSFRNIWFMGSWRLLLWAVLACSATMIHLTYNSVFFVTAQSNQYAAVLTSNATLADASSGFDCNQTSPDHFNWIGTTRYNTDVFANKTGCPAADSLNQALFDVSDFVELSPFQCAQQYGDGLVAGAGSVIIVSTNDTLQGVGWAQWPQQALLAGKTNSFVNAWRRQYQKVLKALGQRTASIRSLDCSWVRSRPLSREAGHEHMQIEIQRLAHARGLRLRDPHGGFHLHHCYLHRNLNPFRTVGDAIANFLGAPDSTTIGMSMADSADWAMFEKTGMKPAGREPSRSHIRWYQTLSKSRWYGTHILNLAYTILLCVVLYFAYTGAHGAALANGPGNVDIQSLASVSPEDSGSSSLVAKIVVANLPQLGYTLVHLCNNGLLTRMMLNREWRRFATERKGLRVSGSAQGEQRDTHFLTMPYRFAVPFMAYSSAVYWLLSQSIFLVQIESLDVHGEVVPSDSMTRLGYSCQAIIISIGVLAIGQCFLLWLGSWKLHPIGMPSRNCHSLAISAACHPPAGERDAQLQKVQWGEMIGEMAGPGYHLYSDHAGHCAISCRQTVPPAEDRAYS